MARRGRSSTLGAIDGERQRSYRHRDQQLRVTRLQPDRAAHRAAVRRPRVHLVRRRRAPCQAATGDAGCSPPARTAAGRRLPRSLRAIPAHDLTDRIGAHDPPGPRGIPVGCSHECRCFLPWLARWGRYRAPRLPTIKLVRRPPLAGSLLAESRGAGESGRMGFSHRRAHQPRPLAVPTRSSSPRGGRAGARPMAARSRLGSYCRRGNIAGGTTPRNPPHAPRRHARAAVRALPTRGATPRNPPHAPWRHARAAVRALPTRGATPRNPPHAPRRHARAAVRALPTRGATPRNPPHAPRRHARAAVRALPTRGATPRNPPHAPRRHARAAVRALPTRGATPRNPPHAPRRHARAAVRALPTRGDDPPEPPARAPAARPRSR